MSGACGRWFGFLFLWKVSASASLTIRIPEAPASGLKGAGAALCRHVLNNATHETTKLMAQCYGIRNVTARPGLLWCTKVAQCQ